MSEARLEWPKHPDGSNKTFAEMSDDERRAHVERKMIVVEISFLQNDYENFYSARTGSGPSARSSSYVAVSARELAGPIAMSRRSTL